MLFTHMEAVIEDSLAVADDCCHGTSHMSQWVSIKDLFIRKSSQCSENTPISSDWEIRFNFHFSQYSFSHLAWKSQNNVKKDKEILPQLRNKIYFAATIRNDFSVNESCFICTVLLFLHTQPFSQTSLASLAKWLIVCLQSKWF